jgi:zinc transport system substrate-binding protein
MYICPVLRIKMMTKISKYLTFICLIICFFACRQSPTDRPVIAVTIEPQKYFVEQLVDSLFKVEVMVPAGVSPETYDPSPLQMAALARSCAYFYIGQLGFNVLWLDKIQANNPQLPIFDNNRHIALIDADVRHEHNGKQHQHTGVDPHTWSSPRSARIIVRNMFEALVSLDAEHKEMYQQRLIQLETEITRTDSILSALFAQAETKSFIIYHPALTYLARDYELTQYCIEMDGKEPSPAAIKQLIATAKATKIQVIFIQEEFDKKNASLIAEEVGCKLMIINPLSRHWSHELIRIAQAIVGKQADDCYIQLPSHE